MINFDVSGDQRRKHIALELMRRSASRTTPSLCTTASTALNHCLNGCHCLNQAGDGLRLLPSPPQAGPQGNGRAHQGPLEIQPEDFGRHSEAGVEPGIKLRQGASLGRGRQSSLVSSGQPPRRFLRDGEPALVFELDSLFSYLLFDFGAAEHTAQKAFLGCRTIDSGVPGA